MADVGGIAEDQLRSFIERIEKLEAEKKQLGDDIKEIYLEARGSHFDVPIMKKIVRERRMDKDDLDEQQNLLELYRKALGMWKDTPLGEYAFADAAE
jgi:uncharacterized protein (UPF0335 family)